VAVARRLTESCPAPGVLESAAATLRKAAEEREANGDAGGAVTCLEALAEPPFAEPGAPAAEWARERIHALLRPTFLETRRSRFNRRSAERWAEQGRYDAASDRVRVPLPVGASDPLEAARLALTDLAVEANEVPEPPDAPYPFEGISLDGAQGAREGGPDAALHATIPLDALFLVVYEHDHVRRNQAHRPQPEGPLQLPDR
jgi:hypothetical protein